MSSNKRIPFTDVVTLTKDICEFIANEKYETLYVPTKDKDNKDTISVISCKENSLRKVKKDIDKYGYVDKEELINNENYCYITTYDRKKLIKEISFDINDDYPAKAEFTDEYEFLSNFFKNFITFRNNLIENNEVVKKDDIYQYFLSLVGFSEMERKYNRDKILTRINRK